MTINIFLVLIIITILMALYYTFKIIHKHVNHQGVNIEYALQKIKYSDIHFIKHFLYDNANIAVKHAIFFFNLNLRYSDKFSIGVSYKDNVYCISILKLKGPSPYFLSDTINNDVEVLRIKNIKQSVFNKYMSNIEKTLNNVSILK